MKQNPILDFEIDREAIRYIGRGLQRPECILAESDGTLWSADARGGVQMSNQRSGAACQQGYSWGYNRDGIWVDHGCRADFSLTGLRKPPVAADYTPPFVGTLKCSSDFGTRQVCPVDTRGRVKLSQQISESSCRLGYSWGYDDNGVWVDHGCRAEFEIGSGR